MYNPYCRGAIMSLLLKEVKEGSIQNRQPGKKLWRVSIGGELIGFIQTGWSLNKRYKYTATTTRGVELDSCANFMQSLSQFIKPAENALTEQGCKEKNYIGCVGLISDISQYFTIERAVYDGADQLMWYFAVSENDKPMRLYPFTMRLQILTGFMEISKP